MQTKSPSPPDTPAPPFRPCRIWLAAIGVVVLLILVEAGYQYWKNSPTVTAPTIAGRPLSNPQTHLHTVVLGDSPDMLYLGTHFGLFWSTDGGHTWPQQQGALAQLMITSVAVSPVDPNTLAVVGLSNTGDASQNGVYISQDAGKTWHLSNPALPGQGLGSPISPYFVEAGADNPDHWYSVFLGAGLYETRDAGAHWSLLTQGALANAQMMSLLIDPADANHLLLGTTVGLYQTRDDGAHWNQVGEVQGDVTALVALPADPGALFCATDAGLWRSTDNGAHFAGLSTPAFSRLAVAGQQQSVLYGLSGQQVWRSSDAGSHWVLASTLGRSDLIAMAGDPTNAQVLYVGYFLPPAVFSSRDGGHSWQVVTS
jgi:photosystem II stability/assembly factor-like uncharacterized protein